MRLECVSLIIVISYLFLKMSIINFELKNYNRIFAINIPIDYETITFFAYCSYCCATL